MATEHKIIPNAELHEPKDVSSAIVGEVYVADGAGSGDWQAQAAQPSTVVNIETVDDFPTAVASVITLAASTIYQINTQVNIGANRLVFSDGSVLQGVHRTVSGITSTTTGALLSGTGVNMRFEHLTFDASASSKLYDFDGGGTKTFSARDCLSITHTALIGNLDNALAIVMDFSLYVGGTSGFVFGGTGGPVVLNTISIAGFTGTAFDLGTAVVNGFSLNGSLVSGTGGADVGLSGLASGGNIATGFVGQVSNINFNGTTAILGNITVDDVQWIFESNSGLQDTRKEAQGHVIGSSDTTVISVSLTSVKLNVGTGFIDDLSRQFTIDNTGRLTYIGITDTTFHLQGAIQGTGVSGTNTYNIHFAKNGAIIESTHAGREFTSTANGTLMTFGLVELSTNDFIELFIENDGATTDFNCLDLNILARG